VGTRIDGKEIDNLVVEFANGAKIRGRLEEMNVPEENRRKGKTKNPDADIFIILANAKAIPVSDADICFCYEPPMKLKRRVIVRHMHEKK
jgi:hypothetical protein